MLLTEAQQSAAVSGSRDLSFWKRAAALSLPRDLSGQVPLYRGQNSIIYAIEAGGQRYALKLLTHNTDADAMESRDACSRFFNATEAPWSLPFMVAPGTVHVGDNAYPALLVEWTDGIPLYAYIDSILGDRKALTALQQSLVALSHSLEEADCSHGDINCHHVVVHTNGDLQLLDYETAFIPAFEGRLSPGAGTPGMQHPKKLATHFSSYSDRFSFWVLLTAIEAIKLLPGLWKEREGKAPRHFLFTMQDLVKPSQSSLFQKLKSYHDPALDYYLLQLEQWCAERKPEKIEPPRLFGDADIPYVPKVAASATRLPTQKEAIIDFYAERTTVVKGSKIILHWNVQGPAPHISGLGKLSSNRGSAEIRATQSGPFTCTVGSVQKTIEITVVAPKTASAKSVLNKTIPAKLPSFDYKKLVLPIAVVIASALYFTFKGNSGNDNTAIQTANLGLPPAASTAPAFTKENIKGFLESLYAAYNERNTEAIMKHYGNKVEQYYEAASLSSDSLQKIIGPLFIQTAFYSCTPDFSTLQVLPGSEGGEVRITIAEKVQNTPKDKVETFRTAVVYKMDASFKILAEKSGS